MVPRLTLEISNQYRRLVSPEPSAVACLRAIEKSELFPISGGELSIAFVDDTTIGEIHDRFMGDPAATDVITFPANSEMNSAGEIIVSVDHARTRAIELNEPFSKELTLYLFHGWLHLAGFNDQTEEERLRMRAAEKSALSLVDHEAECYLFRLSAY